MLDGVFANTPLPGELFADKYRITRILGKGGMGVVLAATHVHLREPFAVKMLLPSAMSDPVLVERFLREGRAAVKIRSEHVARVYDVGELPDKTPYIVMEYLEGSDFGELLEEQTCLPPAQAIDWILQACEAVAEAHALEIIHRDLKPSNLFLARRPNGKTTVKVLDFGISKMSALEPGLAMTRTTTIMGSPLYMSPEQLKSARNVDVRADIWSIGVMLYQLLAGTTPFAAESLAELCAVVLSGRVPWLSDVVPAVPADLAAVIATCLRPDREERYKNLADFADAVAKFGTDGAKISAERIIATLGMPEVRATPFDPANRRPSDAELARTVPERSTVPKKSTDAGLRSSSSAWSAPLSSGRTRAITRGPLVGAAVVVLGLSALGVGLMNRRDPATPMKTTETPPPSDTPVVALPSPSPTPVPEPTPPTAASVTPPTIATALPQRPAAARRPSKPAAEAASAPAPSPPVAAVPTTTSSPLGAATSSKD